MAVLGLSQSEYLPYQLPRSAFGVLRGVWLGDTMAAAPEGETIMTNHQMMQRLRGERLDGYPVEVTMRWAAEEIGKLRAALTLIAGAKDVRGCDEIARQALGGTDEPSAKVKCTFLTGCPYEPNCARRCEGPLPL